MMGDKQERRKRASKLLGGPLRPEELTGDYVVRAPHNAPEAAPETRRATEAPTFDVGAIRSAAQEGLPVLPSMIVALCDRVEALENRDRKSMIVIDNLMALREEAKEEVYRLRPVLPVARAWADAVERMDGIVAAEEALLAAIRGCDL